MSETDVHMLTLHKAAAPYRNSCANITSDLAPVSCIGQVIRPKRRIAFLTLQHSVVIF